MSKTKDHLETYDDRVKLIKKDTRKCFIGMFDFPGALHFKEKHPGRAERLRLTAQNANLPKVDFVALKPVFEKLVKKYELEY